MPQISLAAARVNAGLSQKDAASKIGIAAKTLGNYESGVSVPRWDTLVNMSKIYKIDIDYIHIPNLENGEFDEA